MRIKSLTIKDFRGYRGENKISFDENMTGIVGKNDFGKSTIIEALAIFFEIDGYKADKSDINCFSSKSGVDSFEISCQFDDIPEKIILDENVETSLSDEYLLNSDGFFEVVRIFKGSTGKNEKTAIRCNHPSDENISNILSLKMADLRSLGRKLEIESVVDDKRVSSSWRRAIYQSLDNINLAETLLDVDKGLSAETKNIWKKIQEFLPTFALFKADRESSDSDPEAKNPLQQAVKEAQLALKSEIDALESKIQASVIGVAERTLDKLREMAPELANELKPLFKDKPKWTFNFTLDGENGIPINKRGSGVRRLILLNFFRAEAERSVSGLTKNVIYAIEEPETSQHPNYQIMLMKALLELGQQSNRQIIVTTHVPALAGLIPVEGLRYVCKDASGKPAIKDQSNEVLREVADSLGVLPAPGMERAKGIILVEGKSDVTFLRHASTVLKEEGHISKSLQDCAIVPVVIGGCGSVKHWVTLNLAKDLGLPWCVFLDSDKGGGDSQERVIQKRKEEVESTGNKFFSTRKREIENYICPDVVKEVCGVDVSYSDTCDAKKIIGRAVDMKADNVLDRFWPKMSASDIIRTSEYTDGGLIKSEIIDTIDGIVSIVPNS